VIAMLLRADPAERPDAAATSRLLTTAWADARRASYFGAGSRPPFAQPAPPHEEAGPVDEAKLAPEPSGREATTATQVVTVLGADTSGSAVDDGSGPTGASALAAQEPPRQAEPRAAGLSADTPTKPAVTAAADVVPDLMATPVFAELKMPELPPSVAGPGIAAGSGTAGLQPGTAAGDGAPRTRAARAAARPVQPADGSPGCRCPGVAWS
jgi:hypothetical protein